MMIKLLLVVLVSAVYVNSQDPERCASLPDGCFPICDPPWNCGFYFCCVAGVDMGTTNCPADQIFDVETGNCLNYEDVCPPCGGKACDEPHEWC